MRTTREDLVRWFEAGCVQGADCMVVTSDADVAPIFYTRQEDGTAELDARVNQLHDGRRSVWVIGLSGSRDEQIERFLRLQRSPPQPEMSDEEAKADMSRIFAEMAAIFAAYFAESPSTPGSAKPPGALTDTTEPGAAGRPSA